MSWTNDPWKLNRRLLCWKWACAALGTALAITLVLHIRLRILASYDLSTHYNLYYLDWKAGKRPYEQVVALGGLIHDHEYRKSLQGITIAEFHSIFPNTFYEVKASEETPSTRKKIFMDNYTAAMRGDSSYGWRAVFEDGRLVELEFSKG